MDRREFEELMGTARRRIPVRTVRNAVLGLLALGIFAWGGLTSFYTVEANEVGVLQRFGDYVAPPVDPGLHWKIPFGVDHVETVKVDYVEKAEFGFRTVGSRGGRSEYKPVPDESLMLTGDQNVVSVEWIVQYKIKDPAHWLFNIKSPRDTIRDVSESTMRLVVGDSSATEVLTARRKEISLEVKTKLQDVLDGYESGVAILAVELQNVIPPTAKVQDAFNEVNRARQEKETTVNRARRDYQKAIPEAEGEARRIVQEAEGFKLKRVNEAQGDVALFTKLLAEYQGSEEVTRQRLYLEAMEEVLPHLTHIYILDEEKGGPLQMLDLGSATAGAGAAASKSAPKKNAPADGRKSSRQGGLR